MADDADRLATVDLASLDNPSLAAAIRERQQILDDWEARYREVCIPMAHGIRLFGQVYNDQLRPDDPFAFLDLLAGDAEILAVQRNRKMLELAEILRHDPSVASILRKGGRPDPFAPFSLALAKFTDRFGDLSFVMGGMMAGNREITDLLLEMAAAPPAANRLTPVDEVMFLESFTSRRAGVRPGCACNWPCQLSSS